MKIPPQIGTAPCSTIAGSIHNVSSKDLISVAASTDMNGTRTLEAATVKAMAHGAFGTSSRVPISSMVMIPPRTGIAPCQKIAGVIHTVSSMDSISVAASKGTSGDAIAQVQIIPPAAISVGMISRSTKLGRYIYHSMRVTASLIAIVDAMQAIVWVDQERLRKETRASAG